MGTTKIAQLTLSVTEKGADLPEIECESSGTFEGYFYAAKHLLEQFSTRLGMLAAVRNWAIESGYFELRRALEKAVQSDIAAHHEIAEKLPQTPPDIRLEANMWINEGNVELKFSGAGTTENLTEFFRLIAFDEETQRYALLAAASYVEDSDPVLWRPLANSIKAFVASDLLGSFEGNRQKTEIKINELI